MSDLFLVKGVGGKRALEGEVTIGGAKNAALKLMAGTLLFQDEVILKNVPDIEDISRMSELLRVLGKDVVKKSAHTYHVDGNGPYEHVITPELSKKMRASIVLTGPLLARTKEVKFPHPGGCIIGERPIDLFIEGFKAMGAVVRVKNDMYHLTAEKGLQGARMFLKNQSVTVTETFLMAGVLAKGETIIENASLEPEVADLIHFLQMGGADISGVGTTTLHIKGGKLLSAKGRLYTVLPDRIEAGTFLVLGALAAKKLTIKKCNPDHLTAITEMLQRSGVKMKIGKNSIVIEKINKALKSFSIKTHEYPGFPTDLQAPMTILLTQAEGESLVFETIFEGRLHYTEKLVDMGADIIEMDPHRVMVRGATPLHGKVMESPDLRAGLAYVIAAIVAKGSSVIHNVYNIDRGYERIDERLRAIGVDIVRKTKEEE